MLGFTLGADVDGEDAEVGDFDSLLLDELVSHDFEVSVEQLLSAQDRDLELLGELLVDFFLGGHGAVFEGQRGKPGPDEPQAICD